MSTPPAPPPAPSLTVIGLDGSLGPFRPGMTRAQVQAAITSSGLTNVSIVNETLSETTYRTIKARIGGKSLMLGVFNSESGVLHWIFPPENAKIAGLGLGSPLSSFKSRFGSGYTIKVYPGVNLSSGVRLQLQDEYSMQATTAKVLVLVAPGYDEFVGEWS